MGMFSGTCRLLGSSIAAALCWVGTAVATPVSIGYVAWDVTNPAVAGEFDLVNETGPNASGDATWPVDSALTFSDLSLVVSFSDGTTATFGNAYFLPSADGLSFDGSPIGIGAGAPLPVEAMLAGVLAPLDATLFDGQTDHFLAAFSAHIGFRAGGLADGDLAIVDAVTAPVSSVPEPGTAWLLAAGLLPFLARSIQQRRRLRASRQTRRGAHGLLMAVLAAGVASPACAAIKLNAWSAPANGTAGTTLVNFTATGSPLAATNLPHAVAVSFAESCGGAAVASVAPTSVTSIVGTSVRIQARLPATLTARSYAVSISGATSAGAFASANCSLVNVAAPADDWTTLIERPWTMPAQTEGYKCRTVVASSDMDIVALRAVSAPYQAIVTVADSYTGPVNADFDCGAGSLLKTGVFMAGPGTGELALPTGVAMHVRPGQFVSINLHVVNQTDNTQSGSTLIQMRTGNPATITDEAELALAGTFLINIPSDGVRHTAAGACVAHVDQRIFAVQPHLQAAGVHVTLQRQRGADTATLLDTDYNAASQPIYPVPPALQAISAASLDRLVTTCSYVNTTGGTLTYGESAQNEQCFVGLYRTPPYVPADASAQLYACAEGH
jgi:hypothetical protein